MSDQPKLSDPDYQDKDIDLKVIAISLVCTALVILGSFLSMRALFNSYEEDYSANNRPTSLVGERMLPPQPRLQVNESKDLEAYMKQAQAIANAPRSVDSATGMVRVPVSEAKQIVLKRGLGPVIQQEAN